MTSPMMCLLALSLRSDSPATDCHLRQWRSFRAKEASCCRSAASLCSSSRQSALGATVHTNERTLEWHPTTNGVSVRTERGEYEAETLVISAGAWVAKLLPGLGAAAIPERQVLAWFEILRPEHFTPDVFPVFNLVVDEGQFYGFPEFGIPGFKLGKYHHLEENVDPDTIDREPNVQR